MGFKKMKTSIFAFAAVNAQFNETDITGRNNYAPEEGCPEGHVENNDGFCVQDLPCTHPHTCAYDATCIAGANSWEATCTCNDGFIGDGRYCRVPEGCDEGAGDDGCDCVVLDVQYVNITAAWNDTETCYYLYDPPTVTTCTSVYTPTLPTFTPIEEVVNNVEECVEASVNLQHGWVQEDGIRKNNVLIQAGTDLSIKEWYIRLNYNDPSIVTSVTVYNTQLDLDSGYEILSAMEYNKNLYAGTHTWTGIICSDDEGLSLTADLCYIKYD